MGGNCSTGRASTSFNGAALRGGRIEIFRATYHTSRVCFNGAALRGGRIGDRPPPDHQPFSRFNGAALRGGRIGASPHQSRIPSGCFNGAALRGGRIERSGVALRTSRPPSFNGAALRGGRIAMLAWLAPQLLVLLQRSRPPRRADSRCLSEPLPPSRLSFNGAALRGGRIDDEAAAEGGLGKRFNGAALRGGRIGEQQTPGRERGVHASTEPPSEEGG